MRRHVTSIAKWKSNCDNPTKPDVKYAGMFLTYELASLSRTARHLSRSLKTVQMVATLGVFLYVSYTIGYISTWLLMSCASAYFTMLLFSTAVLYSKRHSCFVCLPLPPLGGTTLRCTHRSENVQQIRKCACLLSFKIRYKK